MLDISYQRVRSKDLDLCDLIFQWNKDPETMHFMTPNFKEADLEPMTYAMVVSSIEHDDQREMYMIKVDDTYVGTITLDINPRQLARKDVKSGWIGIGIGLKAYRGLGVGKATMAFIENRAKELGAHRMELGVFEFNVNAIAFYEKQGYTRFASVDDFTYWNGKWYKDFRYEKSL